MARDVRSGKLQLKFTYKEFVEAVAKIPKEVDFSRLARYHAEERKFKEGRMASSIVDLVGDYEENSEGFYPRGGDLRPTILDEQLRLTEKKAALKTTTDVRKRFRLRLDERREARKDPSADSSSPTCVPTCTIATKVTRPDLNESAKNEYAKWTVDSLKKKCVELGLKKTGSKTELIERLLDPTNRPPHIYRLRQERGLYVPTNLDTSSTAILVAIQIKQDGALVGFEKYAGATKDEIYVLADKIDIKKNPFSGGTTQTGPYRRFFRRVCLCIDSKLVSEKKILARLEY